MLAHAKMRDLPLENYLDRDHLIQRDILTTFAAMCQLPVEQMELGTDGCSAPNFAVPLFNAALGFARMCDPRGLSQERAQACRKITSAMSAYPEMVSGYGEFDEQLMKAMDGSSASAAPKDTRSSGCSPAQGAWTLPAWASPSRSQTEMPPGWGASSNRPTVSARL